MNGSPQTEPPRHDAAALAQTYARIAEKSGRLVTRFLDKLPDGALPVLSDELGVTQAFLAAWSRLLADPLQLARMQMGLWQDYAALWQGSMAKLLGGTTQPVIEPAKGDRRFRHEDWEKSFLYDYIKQSYLIAAKHLHDALGHVEGLDGKTARKVDFYTRQYIDALAPSNFLLTNPEVLRETAATGGENLVRGLDHLLTDLLRGGGDRLRVSMTDEQAFRPGANVAATPGKVVYQNDLIQLIQYRPATERVYRRPLLIIPPWINKYYILDLRESNSFVKWAVERGHTVFIVSWVNPDARHTRKTFEDYLNEGARAALDAVEQATGEREINVIGFCLGGTLLATALGYLAATGDDRVRSATFFATLIDFTQPGELGVFIDEQQVEALERRMNGRGYLEGAEMAGTFNLLRANDLIWSFVVSNYLLGRDPLPFDMLYWNSDSTRMPAAMHSYYLRNMYLENRLVQPGGITLNEVPIDLAAVRTPLYFVSTIEDHIAPWKSTYAGAQRFSGAVRFVLGGSGHIAGIVNPPAANKYGYWTTAEMPVRAEDWLKDARQHPGSWWTDWDKWVARHGGGKVAARMPGEGGLRAIEDAPGSYVKLRVDAKSA